MSITDVVFDLGRVLIDFQYHELLDFLNGHGARYDSIGHLLEQMKIDELKHATTAIEQGAAELPPPVKKLMQAMSKVMTSSAYYI